jgi:hypothetical protein
MRTLDGIDIQTRRITRAQDEIRRELTGGMGWCPIPHRSQLLERLGREARMGGLAAGMHDRRDREGDPRNLVLNAPVMLALASTQEIPLNAGEAFSMRILRYRYPEPFETAFEGAMNVILTRQWNQEDNQSMEKA